MLVASMEVINSFFFNYEVYTACFPIEFVCTPPPSSTLGFPNSINHISANQKTNELI